MPDGLCAVIEKATVKTPPIFHVLQETGAIPERDMFNTYNMGVGMVMIVSDKHADRALTALNSFESGAYVIGEIAEGEEKVRIC